jgi:amino acid adenylation domain-containing protein
MRAEQFEQPRTDRSRSGPPEWCDAETRLHDLVLARVNAAPDAVAVTTGTVSMTYRELVGRARTLAAALRRAGAGAGTFVGVAADRSPSTVVGFLGVLLCGAAYVPLASDLPRERTRRIAAEAGISLLTGLVAPDDVPFPALVVPLAGQEAESADADTAPPAVNADEAAYVIFTSGSTGGPKGVVISHAAAVHSTLARFEVYPHESMTYLVSAPLAIDAAVAGLYFTFAAGGRVVLPTAEDALDPLSLADLIVREAVSHLDALPSHYAAVLEYHAEALRSVRCVILGGDTLPFRLMRRHLALAGHAELCNEYGPTEATVWSSWHRCSEADVGPLVPIGRPISGARIKVLTQKLALAQDGPGEICVSGPGLARGYLGQPARTAERFIPDPDPRYPGERMYRTGDLGQLDDDGILVFHGRTDHLVKVRGFRVEPGEVEARLLEHPDLRDAVVVGQQTAAGHRLAAIVVAEPSRNPGSRMLADFLAERLPSYMVPNIWRRAESLPTTAAGKVDRAWLTREVLTTGWELPR